MMIGSKKKARIQRQAAFRSCFLTAVLLSEGPNRGVGVNSGVNRISGGNLSIVICSNISQAIIYIK